MAGSGASAGPNDLADANVVGTDVNATRNWWGTPDATAIDRHIWDNQDDAALGTVTYTPFLTATIPLPDFTASSLSNPPSAAKRGTSFGVTDTVANGGAGTASASTVGFYLGPTKAKGATATKLAGTQALTLLAPGADATTTSRVTVPTTTPVGRYYLIACANDNHLVLESNPKNDCTASATQVQVW
jgi:hypothetical protein